MKTADVSSATNTDPTSLIEISDSSNGKYNAALKKSTFTDKYKLLLLKAVVEHSGYTAEHGETDKKFKKVQAVFISNVKALVWTQTKKICFKGAVGQN